MPQRKAKESSTTRPKGLNEPGMTRAVRGKPNKRAAVDIPIEVPVYVHYERHMSTMVDKGLLGYSAIVECFTFGWEIAVKMSHPKVRGGPRTLEVWAIDREGGRKKIFRQVVEETHQGSPPATESANPDEESLAKWFGGGEDVDFKYDGGWPTHLGKDHGAAKAMEQRKSGRKPKAEPIEPVPGRISGDDIIFDDDDEPVVVEVESEDDDIEWED